MAEAKYTPALSMPVVWNCQDNKFDDKDMFPKTMSLFIPLESAHEFAQYIINMADTIEKHRDKEVWDHKTSEARSVQGFYINSKGRSNQYGAIGNMNPAAIKTPCSTGNCPLPAPQNDLPF